MEQSDKQSITLRTPRNEIPQGISHACAKAPVCRAELHTLRQWGCISQNPANTWEQLGFRTKTAHLHIPLFSWHGSLGRVLLWGPEGTRETGCSQAGESHLSEVLPTLQKCITTSSVVNEK